MALCESEEAVSFSSSSFQTRNSQRNIDSGLPILRKIDNWQAHSSAQTGPLPSLFGSVQNVVLFKQRCHAFSSEAVIENSRSGFRVAKRTSFVLHKFSLEGQFLKTKNVFCQPSSAIDTGSGLFCKCLAIKAAEAAGEAGEAGRAGGRFIGLALRRRRRKRRRR